MYSRCHRNVPVWNRRTAVVRLNRSLENVIRTVTRSIKNARSTVRQHALRSTGVALRSRFEK